MTSSPWQYFSMEELQCHGNGCCGHDMKMDAHFMATIVQLRRELGFPFFVPSAYRCPVHNNNVSHTGLHGPHTTGRAIDIHVYGERAFKLVAAALRAGITGTGISQKGPVSDRFIHLDNLSGDTRPRVWSY